MIFCNHAFGRTIIFIPSTRIERHIKSGYLSFACFIILDEEIRDEVIDTFKLQSPIVLPIQSIFFHQSKSFLYLFFILKKRIILYNKLFYSVIFEYPQLLIYLLRGVFCDTIVFLRSCDTKFTTSEASFTKHKIHKISSVGRVTIYLISRICIFLEYLHIQQRKIFKSLISAMDNFLRIFSF